MKLVTVLGILMAAAQVSANTGYSEVQSRDFTCSELRELVKDEGVVLVNNRLYVSNSTVCHKVLTPRGPREEVASNGGYEFGKRSENGRRPVCYVGTICTIERTDND